MTVPALKPVSILCCLFTALALLSSIFAAPERRGVKKKPSALCRFTLGEVFTKSNQKNRDRFLEECKISLKQVMKAFDDCKLTVVKKRVARADGKPGTEEDLELVVEGRQRFVFKDANKKDISLNVKNIRIVVSSVNHSKKPTRFRFLISFEIDGKHTIKLLGRLDATHTFTWGFTCTRPL